MNWFLWEVSLPIEEDRGWSLWVAAGSARQKAWLVRPGRCQVKRVGYFLTTL